MSGAVRILDASSRSETAHGRAAELVREQRRLVDRLDSFFREIAEVRELLLGEGSRWAGPACCRPFQSAYAPWSSPPHRELGEPPTMQHEDELVELAAVERARLIEAGVADD